MLTQNLISENQIHKEGSYKLMQFPGIFDVFSKDLMGAFGDLWDFGRAMGSLIAIFGIIYFLLTLLGGKQIGLKPNPKVAVISFILGILCSFDYCFIYFRL